MINSDILELQNEIKKLKTEIIKIKNKTKNIPLNSGVGGGSGGIGRVIVPYGQDLPSPNSFLGVDDSTEAKLAIIKGCPDYYCSDTRAWYRLVLDANLDLTWAAITLIRLANAQTTNNTIDVGVNIPPGELAVMDRGYSPDYRLYFVYIPKTPPLINEAGCISHSDYWDAD